MATRIVYLKSYDLYAIVCRHLRGSFIIAINFPRASAPGLVSFAPLGLMYAKATAASALKTFADKFILILTDFYQSDTICLIEYIFYKSGCKASRDRNQDP